MGTERFTKEMRRKADHMYVSSLLLYTLHNISSLGIHTYDDARRREMKIIGPK